MGGAFRQPIVKPVGKLEGPTRQVGAGDAPHTDGCALVRASVEHRVEAVAGVYDTNGLARQLSDAEGVDLEVGSATNPKARDLARRSGHATGAAAAIGSRPRRSPKGDRALPWAICIRSRSGSFPQLRKGSPLSHGG